ncbi:MAG: hypothetical protein AB8H79_07300 [Myxococcota bacterium]
MAPRTRWIVLGVLGCGVVGLVSWAVWTYGQHLWWTYASQQGLSAEELAQVEACEAPPWTAMLKVLEQDLEVDCPPTWFGDAGRERVKKRHRRRANWLREVVEREVASPRQRFRAGSALLMADRDEPTDLMVWADLAGVPRADLVDALQDEAWPLVWADPDLRDDVRRTDASFDEPESVQALLRRLSGLASMPAALRPEGALAELNAQAQSVLGLEPDAWDRQVTRRESGLTVSPMPVYLHQLVQRSGSMCRGAEGRGTVECAHRLTDALRQQMAAMGLESQGTELPLQPSGARRALLAYLAAGDALGAPTAEAQAEDLATWGRWVSEAPEPDRARRLMSVVSGDPAGSLEPPSHPQAVVRHHTGRPWTVAATAMALGDVAGVTVDVGWTVDGVGMQAGEERRVLGPCGRWIAVQPSEVQEAPWPGRAVWAQAVAEAVSGALARQDVEAARRLARLAHLLDPIGADGFVDAVEQALPAASTLSVANLLAPPPMDPAPSADAAGEDRRAVAALLKQGWTPSPRCDREGPQ